MADKHLLLSPRNVRGLHNTRKAWRYEDPGGICVVVEAADSDGNYLVTSQVLITWRAIRASLRRKDKADTTATD